MSDNNNININTPEIGPYTQLRPFRFWCQKVLPLVYDESLSYYELLCKVVDFLNKTMEDVDQMIIDMGEFQEADTTFKTDMVDRFIAFSREVTQTVDNLESFMNEYFDNLDVQDEIDNKIDEMAEEGYFDALFARVFGDNVIGTTRLYVSGWIETHLLQETGYVIDKSLTVENAAADAKATGIKITEVHNDLYSFKEDMKPVYEHTYSPNRFNKNGDIIRGHYLNSSGELVESANFDTSDYCYVEDFTQIWCSQDVISNETGRNYASFFYLCTYDKDKNFIRYVGSMVSNPFTLLEGESYIRFSFNAGGDAYQIMVTNNDLVRYYGYYEYEGVSQNARKAFEDSFDFVQESITLNNNKMLVGNRGNVTDFNNYRTSNKINVTPNTKIMVNTSSNYGQGLVCFYDENDDVIKIEKAETGSATTYYRCKIIDVPFNAATMVISGTTSANISVFKGVPQSSFKSMIWSNKKWACVGDSLTEYNGRTDVHYFDYIKAASGIQIYNMGVSGCGYAAGVASNFMTRISDVPTDSDVITIFGSGNDLSTGLPLGTASDTGTSTLGGCINETIDNLYDVIPVPQLGIITPTPWVGNMPYDNGAMERYANLIVEICKRRSIPCLDLYHCSNLNPNSQEVREIAYSKDDGNGVHPNEYGHKIIASRIRAFLDSLILP